MECRGAPEEVERDPPDVVAQLVVVRIGEQRVRVRRVDREQRDDAPDEEVEGGRALAVVDGEAHRGCEKEDVAERIRGGDGLLERRQAREVDVRRDEEHPREQGDADRDDQRVDHAGAVTLRVTPTHEDEQPGHERRVHGEVDGVADRGELDLDAHQLRIAVRVEIAGEEEEVPDDEQDPGHARLRPVEVDPHGDRHRRRKPEHVDERPARLERRDRQVCHREQDADAEVDRPEPTAPVDAGEQVHAAYSWRPAGRRSNAFASLPSTSTSWSISAHEFAAVTWIRNPTSLLGTSG